MQDILHTFVLSEIIGKKGKQYICLINYEADMVLFVFETAVQKNNLQTSTYCPKDFKNDHIFTP